MPIAKPEIPVECDHCDNSYTCSGSVTIRPGWRVMRVDGEDRVICPRHQIVTSVADYNSSAEALDNMFDEVRKAARRVGIA